MEKKEGLSEPESRLAYLSVTIFGFTTYDDSLDVLYATKAVEVCAAITNRTTSKYIVDRSNYEWYVLMCNTPFFSERIEWGTSIRGAWWSAQNGKKIELESSGLWVDQDQLRDELQFSVDEWRLLITAVIEFAAPEMPALLD